jgi:glyoxylase I family protein
MAADAGHFVSGFHHVALRARDFEASLRFYINGLGLDQKAVWGKGNERAVMLDAGGGNCVEVFAGGGAPRPEGALLHLAFRTTNCDAALAAARAAGATVTMEPETIQIKSVPPATARIAFCTGPDGEVIEFFQSADI